MKPGRLSIQLFVFLASLLLTACTTTPTPVSTPEARATGTAVSSTLTATAEATPTVATTTTASHELPGATPIPNTSPIKAVWVNAEHNLYTWTDGDSSFTQITSSGDAVDAKLSSDGSLVAYTRTADSQAYSLEVIRSDGTNPRTLFTHDQFLALPRIESAIDTAPSHIEWVPNSHLLAMAFRYTFEGPGSRTGHNLIVFNAEDGTLKTLLNENQDWDFSYSPDGSKIVVSLPDGIDLYDANGKLVFPPKFFGFPNINTASEYEYTPKTFWSTDSTAFAFTLPPIEPFIELPGDTRVIKINARDASVTTPLSKEMVYLGTISISPDLSQIAYLQRVSSQTGAVDLHIASLVGNADEVYLTGAHVNSFVWAPDSHHFIYALAEGPAVTAHLGQVGEAGNQLTQVTSFKEAKWLDAQRYFILDQSSAGWKIWLGELGATLQTVYSDSITVEPMGFSPSLNLNR